MQLNDIKIAKKAAGTAAAALIERDMLVGIGTGSTVYWFIQALGERCRKGLKIKAVATSEKSLAQALQEGIEMIEINTVSYLDLVVDGADEIDRDKNMIKGGGGALLREKILANIAHEMIVLVDQSKLVNHLGAFPLPVEIVPFAHQITIQQLGLVGYQGTLRLNEKKEYYVTDNGNYILDVKLSQKCTDPAFENDLISAVPGVVETGFFIGVAGRLIVGYQDGHIEIK